jgi:hypothetical protein
MSVIVLAHTKFKPCGMELRGHELLLSEASLGYGCENIEVSVRECGSVHKSVARYFFCSRKLIHYFQVSVSRKIVQISFSISESVFYVVILRSQLEGGYYKHSR